LIAPAQRLGSRPRLQVLPGGRGNLGGRADPGGRGDRGGRGNPGRRGNPGGRGNPDVAVGDALAARRGGSSGRRFLSAALATAGAWLVEPVEASAPSPESAARSPARPRTVIAVFGLAPGCGATVVSRAVAAELAARDPTGTAAVAREARASAVPLATQAASRLARALEDLPGAATKAVGRLCLVEGADHVALAESSRHLAPLVLDAGSVSVGGVPAAVADVSLLVATPTVEPALARAAAGCLARMRAEAIVVFNRSRPAPASSIGEGEDSDAAGAADSETEAALRLPDSRVGAQLALGGREARGDLGRAIAALADRCELVADRCEGMA
jgi:hypothetical protein